MLCKFCGAETPDGSSYCTECGKKLENESAPESKDLPAVVPDKDAPPPPPPHRRKKTSLVAPIIILLIAASGWLYILSSNSIEGMLAWFTSSNDLQNSVSTEYNYFNNNFSGEELAANIILLVIMVLFTVLAVVGVVMLIKRIVRKVKRNKRMKEIEREQGI